jgi:hypothetical protein
MQQFIKILSSKNGESSFWIICRYISASFSDNSNGVRWLFSLSLNHSFLRILRCGGPLTTDPVIVAYSTIIKRLTLEQKRLVVNSGAWPILLALHGSNGVTVVKAAALAMSHLVKSRNGEDYARFVEEGLFEDIMKQYRPPDHILIEIPFMRNASVESEDFIALGRTWSASVALLL